MVGDLGWGGETTQDERFWASLAHLSGFVIPVLGPLFVYFFKKDESAFVAYHSVQSAIFQVVAWVITGATCGLGSVLLLVQAWMAWQAYHGEWAGYPMIDSAGRPRRIDG